MLAVTRAVAAFLLLICLPLMAWPAQRNRQSRLPGFFERSDSTGPAEFTFVRLKYYSPGRGFRRGAWATDYPKADEQFIYGLRGWARSRLDISDEPDAVSALEPQLFKYPFIYVVEPGFMELSQEEAAALREYLLRGGFMILDDFWGEYEWWNVQEQMQKVFPEYQIQELPLTHPVFHCYFNINEVVQVPNIGNAYRGITHEKGGIIPYYLGIHDNTGRLLVFIARNTDNGDAWEWIDDPGYPLKYGLAAYRLGMNVIVYAMTH
jgi:hypothetical protein